MESPVSVAPWHPITHPACDTCHGLSRPVRQPRASPPPQLRWYERIVPCTGELVQLAVHPRLRDNRRDVAHLQLLIMAARLPQREFAQLIGVDDATLSGYLHGKTIPATKRSHIRSIRAIQRNADEVYVIHHVGPQGRRWEATLARRDHRRANPLDASLETVAAISRQLATRLQSHGIPPSYSRQLSTPE